jgi:hypothetical protein
MQNGKVRTMNLFRTIFPRLITKKSFILKLLWVAVELLIPPTITMMTNALEKRSKSRQAKIRATSKLDHKVFKVPRRHFDFDLKEKGT